VTASVGNLEPNVSSVSIDPKEIFPDAMAHITDVKRQISVATKEIEALRPKLKTAISSVQQIGFLNVGDKSFRGKNGPQVYVANDPNNNSYIVRGNFMVNGRPFRVQNNNSFNSVLSHMKERRRAASTALMGLRETQTQFKQLEGKLAALHKDYKNSTDKIRRNMANYTAKRAKTLRKEAKSSATMRVGASTNTQVANALLQTAAPKKTFFQRMFGRGGKRKGNTRRTRRNTRR
jgi:hypothetical protein